MIVLLQSFIIFIFDMNIHNLFTFLRTEQQKDLIYYTLIWDNFNMVSENL